jgi:hypothetical protein
MGLYGLTGSAALSAATTTYLFGVVGAATADGETNSVDISFDAGTLGQGIKVELFRATGGIPTATTYTALRLNGEAQARASNMASVWVAPVTTTPTGLTVIKTWYVPNTSGQLVQLPHAKGHYIIPAANNWMGLRVVTPSGVNPNCGFNADWNE